MKTPIVFLFPEIIQIVSPLECLFHLRVQIQLLSENDPLKLPGLRADKGKCPFILRNLDSRKPSRFLPLQYKRKQDL